MGWWNAAIAVVKRCQRSGHKRFAVKQLSGTAVWLCDKHEGASVKVCCEPYQNVLPRLLSRGILKVHDEQTGAMPWERWKAAHTQAGVD